MMLRLWLKLLLLVSIVQAPNLIWCSDTCVEANKSSSTMRLSMGTYLKPNEMFDKLREAVVTTIQKTVQKIIQTNPSLKGITIIEDTHPHLTHHIIGNVSSKKIGALNKIVHDEINRLNLNGVEKNITFTKKLRLLGNFIVMELEMPQEWNLSSVVYNALTSAGISCSPCRHASWIPHITLCKISDRDFLNLNFATHRISEWTVKNEIEDVLNRLNLFIKDYDLGVLDLNHIDLTTKLGSDIKKISTFDCIDHCKWICNSDFSLNKPNNLAIKIPSGMPKSINANKTLWPIIGKAVLVCMGLISTGYLLFGSK